MAKEKSSRQAANVLMIAYNLTTPERPAEDARQAYSVTRGPSGQAFLLNAEALNAIRNAVRKVATYIDFYPMDKCANRLKMFVVEERDAGTPIAQVNGRFRTKILDFLNEFEAQAEWEFVCAIKGIDPEQANFSVGPCNFYVMDDEQFSLWARRYSSGQYTPPIDAPILADWNRDESALRGQIAAAVRIRAADKDHAITKGRQRIEEALNVLRYGQLVIGFPEKPFPQIGLWIRQWRHDHSFAMRLDARGFNTNRTLGGPEGNSISVSRHAPGWNGWENLIQSDFSARNDLQIRLTTALQWIGQAALAPSSSIRLVALVTSLEALLIDDDEGLGKKAKLTSRVSKLAGRTAAEEREYATQMEVLYGTRSECVHTGLFDVESEELSKAIRLVARTVEALLTRAPYSTTTSLTDLLNLIDAPVAAPPVDRNRWVAENAYLRWRDETENPGKDRSLQHWLDAEREYNNQHPRIF